MKNPKFGIKQHVKTDDGQTGTIVKIEWFPKIKTFDYKIITFKGKTINKLEKSLTLIQL